jgi:hypothetical protein
MMMVRYRLPEERAGERVMFRLTTEERKRLEAVATARAVTMSRIVREAINEYLDKRGIVAPEKKPRTRVKRKVVRHE